MTNLEITNAYMGVSEVDKIYLGDALIYPTTPPTPPEPVYSAMPLTFEILSDGDIKWVSTTSASTSAKTIEYNLNDSGWTSITSTTGESAPTISVHSGDTIQFRGNNNQYGYSSTLYNYFSGSAQFNAYGNIMSLFDPTGYTTMVEFPIYVPVQILGYMFYKNQGIVSAENLILPVTAFSGQNIYSYMFASATSLTLPPKILPATELVNTCYGNMFRGCTSLTKAPELPAKVLKQSCYTNMFRNCSSLNYIKCLATDISASSCLNNWVNGVASAGTFVKDVNMYDWTIGTSGIPVNWVIQDEGEPIVYSAMPLTFEILSAGTITWTKYGGMADRVLYYSTDDGDTWNTITSTTAGTEINVNAGDKVMFAGNNAAYASTTVNDDYTSFGGTAIYNIYGNIMSLANRTGYTTATTFTSTRAFKRLFMDCTSLRNAGKLILPVTTLNYCYNGMFLNCTNLTKAPKLPATTVTQGCYTSMFGSCTNLTQAPELPATTLIDACYKFMFDGCSKLSYIKCLATTSISPENNTYFWISGVAASGIFVKDPNTVWSSGTDGRSGIPENWTVVDAS